MSYSHKFQIKIWGIDISAQGVGGILAACFLVVFIFIASRY
jgi:hypothetical protein